jgi:hypothetical protein
MSVPRRKRQHIHDQDQVREPPDPTRDVARPCRHVVFKVVVLRDIDTRRAGPDMVRRDFELGRGDCGDDDVRVGEAGVEWRTGRGAKAK